MKRPMALFLSLVALGLIASWIFLRMPANAYDWMRDDPVAGSAIKRVPSDPDALMTLSIFAAPVLIVAIVNLVHGLRRLHGLMRGLSIAFSLCLLAVVAFRLLAAAQQ